MYQLKRKAWANRQLSDLPKRVQKDVAEILLDLRDNPYPKDSLAMARQYEGFRRIRVDGYRIIYKVDDNAKEVWIWKIAPRDGNTYVSLVP